MRIDDTVGYVDADGKRHTATITALSGSGESGFKMLDLTYREGGEDVSVAKVPHEGDAEPGQPFWLEKGARRAVVEDGPEEPWVEEPPATEWDGGPDFA